MTTLDDVTQVVQAYGDTRYSSRDSEVAALQQQVADVQAEFDAYKASHPDSTPPAPQQLWGTTNSTDIVRQGIVRTYDSGAGPRDWSLTTAKQYTSQGIPVCDSCHPSKSNPDPGWSQDAAKVTAVTNWVTSVPDMEGIRLTITHEPEAGAQYGSGGAAQFVTDQAKFTQIVRTANNSRQHPIKVVRTLMGYNIAGKDMGAWLQGDFDELGSDIYQLNQVQPSLDLAARFNKPLCVPECGFTTSSGKTDAQVKDFMTQLVPLLEGKTTWVCWFDSGYNDLVNRPLSEAYWQSVIDSH